MNGVENILDLGVHDLFARQVARRPEAIAAVDASGSISYAALASKADAISGQLIRRKLRAEQPVAVLTDRTTDLVATLLGILAAGGCYVPVDKDDPPDRIRHIINVTGCSLVIGRRERIATFREHLKFSASDVEFLAIEDCCTASVRGAHEIADDTRSGPRNTQAPGGRRLAYILFTSGSTGLPKGVEVEHRSVVNLLMAVSDLIAFTESDRYFALSKIGFDISVAELFLPLLSGGTVVLGETELVMQPRQLAAALVDNQITVFQTGPSVWSILLAEVPTFPRLRVAISTGEAISPDLARRLADVGDSVWNLYGPTETTVWATGHKLQTGPKEAPSRSKVSAPIGRPLPNVTIRILDDQLAVVPAGAEGELWIGGEALARGYCNSESLTRERFVSIGDAAERFYRTGDVVAQDADGTLHYFGRNDDQIKVRGVRIEPMEVESAILKHPQVASAAATWFTTASGSRSIVAAIVGRPNHQLDPESLHRHLQDLLTPAVIPSRFVFCDILPLSPNGKIDRKAIRARAAEAPAAELATAPQEQTTPTEKELIRIWEKTLNVRPISRDHHFFTIGGDSLSAVTMLLEAESAFDLSLSVRTVFESPTVRKLAAHIDRARAQLRDHGNEAFVFPLSPQGRGTPVFFCGVDLRMARQGMWTADCPLYSVSLWAQGRGFVEASSMEELAQIELGILRTIQPAGPYRLAGFSFGALLALEMAHQLQRAGEKVELLFLLNPSEPSSIAPQHRQSSPDSRATQRPGNERQAACSTGFLTRGLQAIQSRARGVWEWLSYYRVHLYGKKNNSISTLLLPKNRWPAVWYAAKRLAKHYAPPPYQGEVLAILEASQKDRSLWTELLPCSGCVQTLGTGKDGWFTQPVSARWMAAFRSRIDTQHPQPTP
jgi:amino acid adenylation domain-containing protein